MKTAVERYRWDENRVPARRKSVCENTGAWPIQAKELQISRME